MKCKMVVLHLKEKKNTYQTETSQHQKGESQRERESLVIKDVINI